MTGTFVFSQLVRIRLLHMKFKAGGISVAEVAGAGFDLGLDEEARGLAATGQFESPSRP